MDIGSLEYVVIGVENAPFTQTIRPELHALQSAAHLRVVDLLFVQKHADGSATTHEVHDLSTQARQPYANLVDDLAGLFTAEDVAALRQALPPPHCRTRTARS